MKVFILVGGLGTRLREVIEGIPKPMAPIGEDGIPFLEYRIMYLKREGFRHIVFCAGYLAEHIRGYFGDGSKWGISIEYSVEEEPLGTGGALKHAERYVDGPFFSMNGDTYLRNDFSDMIALFEKQEAEAVLLTCPPVNPKGEGRVLVDDENRVYGFLEKPEDPNIDGVVDEQHRTNAGIYLFHPKVIEIIPKGQKVSLEREIFPILVRRNRFFATHYKGYFIDIGVPRFYEKFQEDVRREIVKID